MSRISSAERAMELVISDHVRGSALYKKLSEGERRRFDDIMFRLKEDTRYELTETEYFLYARRLYFVEKIELLIERAGFENVPKEVLAMYDRSKIAVQDIMRRYREGKLTTKSSVEGLRKIMEEVVGQDGTLKIEYTPKEQNGKSIRTGTDQEDQTNGGGELDSDTVRDQKGDGQPIVVVLEDSQ